MTDPDKLPIGDVIQGMMHLVLPPELAARRDAWLAEYNASVAEIRERATRVFGELMLNEIERLYEDGFPKESCYLPAANNLAVRKKEIQDELVAEVGRLQGQLRERFRLLAEEAEDWA